MLFGAPATADEVHLQGGTILRGEVLSAEGATGAVRMLLPGGDVIQLARADVKTVHRETQVPAPGAHLRYVAPKDGAEGGLDVAVTYYAHPDGGPRVELVGAVHIGEAAYYKAAQAILDRASIVLYEGVKPKDATAEDFEKAKDADNPVRALQTNIAKWFGLTFQLDGIDYTRPNFVHADMTVEEFSGPQGRAQGKTSNGANDILARTKRLTLLMKLIAPILDNLIGDAESAGPLRNRFKNTFARMLGTVDVNAVLGSAAPELTELLLDKRNKVVIERLLEQRQKPDVRTIAVFYGAAHMEGLEVSLRELGYKRTGARWLRSWVLK